MSDKRRNINAQKIEAQKRLYRSSKRPETTDMSELDKRRAHIEKRREELVCTKYRSWCLSNKEGYDQSHDYIL